MTDKANILVMGPSGAGKSTLINAVIGKEVDRINDGRRGTEKLTAYESDELNLRLIDSRGFGDGFWDSQKTIRDMSRWMRAGLKGDRPLIHMLWFCVDASSKRLSTRAIRTMEAVKREWKDIPVIVVLTKSYFPDEDQENIKMVEEAFRKATRNNWLPVGKGLPAVNKVLPVGNKWIPAGNKGLPIGNKEHTAENNEHPAENKGMPVAIIPVLAKPPKSMPDVPRGIEELIKATEENLDAAVKDSEEAVYRYELKRKRMNAHALTALATSSAAVVGAVPINLPDSVVLSTMETALISSIAKIYNLDKKDDRMQKVMARIIEAGAVSMTAKMALNQLKMIPGVANIAADVLNAVVAGAIVFGIGEASGVIMEKVYLGEIDEENLDWINKIVNGKMGSVVGQVVRMVASNNGKINIKEIIESLVKRT